MQSTVILLVIVYFAVIPIIFGILRAASIWKWQFWSVGDALRYASTDSIDEPSISDSEMYDDETDPGYKKKSVR